MKLENNTICIYSTYTYIYTYSNRVSHIFSHKHEIYEWKYHKYSGMRCAHDKWQFNLKDKVLLVSGLPGYLIEPK